MAALFKLCFTRKQFHESQKPKLMSTTAIIFWIVVLLVLAIYVGSKLLGQDVNIEEGVEEEDRYM